MKVHSEVGLVTNSSTSIYTTADQSSIEGYKEFANTLLKMSGSDKTVDDFLDFRLVLTDESLRSVIQAMELDYHLENFGAHALVSFLTPEELKLIQDYEDGKVKLQVIEPIVRRILAAEMEHWENAKHGTKPKFLHNFVNEDGELLSTTTLKVVITDKQGNPVPETILFTTDSWEDFR